MKWGGGGIRSLNSGRIPIRFQCGHPLTNEGGSASLSNTAPKLNLPMMLLPWSQVSVYGVFVCERRESPCVLWGRRWAAVMWPRQLRIFWENLLSQRESRCHSTAQHNCHSDQKEFLLVNAEGLGWAIPEKRDMKKKILVFTVKDIHCWPVLTFYGHQKKRANFLPKLIDMLLFSTEKNWISIFFIPLFPGIALATGSLLTTLGWVLEGKAKLSVYVFSPRNVEFLPVFPDSAWRRSDGVAMLYFVLSRKLEMLLSLLWYLGLKKCKLTSTAVSNRLIYF